MKDVLDEWQEFVALGPAGQPRRDLILISWSRSRLAGLDPDVGTAAPIHDAAGRVVGAIDISTAVGDGRPELLVRAMAAAGAIQEDLTGSSRRFNA